MVKIYTGCPKTSGQPNFEAIMHPMLQATFTGLEMTLLRNVSFWSFLTKTKQDHPPPSQVHEKIWHTAPELGYDYCVQKSVFNFF